MAQCQEMCEGMGTSGKDGCCEWQADWQKCVWQEHLDLKSSGTLRYGTLCEKEGIHLLIF